MAGSDEDAVEDHDGANDDPDVEPRTGLLIAGAMLGLGIGVVMALVTGDTALGLSIGVALGVVIPSGIRGSRQG